MHEFEALPFSDVSAFSWVVDGWNERVEQALSVTMSRFPNPEDINEGRSTCPSKRILDAFDDRFCRKREHGPIVAEAIGLPTIRRRCPGFHEWVEGLEALAAVLPTSE